MGIALDSEVVAIIIARTMKLGIFDGGKRARKIKCK